MKEWGRKVKKEKKKTTQKKKKKIGGELKEKRLEEIDLVIKGREKERK